MAAPSHVLKIQVVVYVFYLDLGQGQGGESQGVRDNYVTPGSSINSPLESGREDSYLTPGSSTNTNSPLTGAEQEHVQG